MQTPFGPVLRPFSAGRLTPFLQRGSLAGERIGIDRRYFTPDFGGEPDLVAVAGRGLDAMASLGATLVETDTGDPSA